ncbi:MAG: 1-deoxy-D-xylulose-5-phosphate synthase [Bacillota bacterium]|nr:1-deoxy-D-xylulose-5-phosphate synthase [Bacillota bacterium]
MYKILDEYKDFTDIKNMDYDQLDVFAKEIREFLVEKVSKTGGHLASNLGVVELTLSLLRVFNVSSDKLIWDVGHQAYVYKILTGRKDKFDNLRKFGGISGFPKREESIYDFFDTGHSSTSISAALGMAIARDINGEKNEVVSVIGDGALTGGMAFEALNDAGYRKTKIIIILNDNQMSIAKNVGGMSKYLNKLRLDPKYTKFKEDVDFTLKKIPGVGKGMVNSMGKMKDAIKQLIVPSMLFEDMGIKYLGPIDGHNIKELSEVLSMAKNIKDSVIIHIITTKGKGYEFAEKNPNKFHGIGPFDSENGKTLVSSIETYSNAFGNEMIEIAKSNKNLVAITAAMRDGTGLSKFSKMYPERFFDVGIAEQHAVTLAAGMACQGLKPVFAVYSTFLQRAYDQVLHDISIQKLPIVLAIDRAGIVGEDGETHQGIFDLSYLSHIPNMTIMSPKCVEELKVMLRWAVEQNYPIALRYPKGGNNANVKISPIRNIKLGKWEVIYEGDYNKQSKKVAILSAGKMVEQSIFAKEKLSKAGISCTLINACFIKPIDKELLKKLVQENYFIVTIEDNIIHGGLGSLVLEYINTITSDIRVLNLGYNNEFIPQGSVEQLYKIYKLDADGITESILNSL